MATGKDESIYPIDPENAVEMARLLNQDTAFTKALGGPLAEQGDGPTCKYVLDLACGPGGWVLDVARMLPDAQVMGVDISALMTDYGRATAKARSLQNAHFMTMNIQEPFSFADNSFDLINARYLVAVLIPNAWPVLLRETFRMCQPGGIMRLTENEMPITNSPAFEQITQMALNAFSMTGRNFGPTARNFGITPMLPKLLKDTGYTNVKYKAYGIDTSAGTEGHESFYQNHMVAFQLGKPYFVGLELTTDEKYEELYQQMLQEMMADDFCAISYSLTAWGEKPE